MLVYVNEIIAYFFCHCRKARGVRANSLLRAYTPENFARELDAVTHAFLEGLVTIDPIRKEVCVSNITLRYARYNQKIFSFIVILNMYIDMFASCFRTAAVGFRPQH